MFSDPQSVTYAAIAKSLPRISTDEDNSLYQLNDSGVLYKLDLSHTFAKRNRCVARLQRDSYAADVLVPANSILASMTASFTLDFPSNALTSADAQALGKALVGWLSDANILKLANGET